MQKNFHFDALDRRIVEQLEKDARMSYVAIAKLCKVTHTAVQQRIRKMKENGIMAGSQIAWDTAKMGYYTCAFIGIQVNLTSTRTHDEVFEKIKQIPEIVECHHISGKYSLLIKILARNNEHLKQIIVEQIQSIPEITFTETFISLEKGFSRQIPLK